jgi:GNAT superfamily N-acetyltransferase
MIDWCDVPEEAASLAAFFAQNITSEYISHSELQGARAQAPGLWSDTLVATLEQDFRGRCTGDHGPPPEAKATRHAIAARRGSRLVGVAMLTFSREAAKPFGVIEDIVIAKSERGNGLGTYMMNWIFEAFRARGLKRVFLESGEANHDAHDFFARFGLKQVSIVMMAEIEVT